MKQQAMADPAPRVTSISGAGPQPASVWRVTGPQLVIAIIFQIIFAAVVYIVFTETLSWDETQKSIAIYLLGILSAVLTQVVGFFYTSSAGSKMKDAAPKG